MFGVSPPRPPALEGARGLAVAAVVLGHTLGALLSPQARGWPWVPPGGLLAGGVDSLLLLVSGWGLVAALGPNARAEPAGPGRRAGQGLLLVVLGYGVSWPGWQEGLAQRWGFGLLQCLGLCLVLGACVVEVARSAWLRALLLGALAVGIALAGPGVWSAAAGLPQPLRLALGAEPAACALFPWAGFFFTGALAAHLLRLLRPGWPQGLALALLGLGLGQWATSAGQGLLVLGAVHLAPPVLTRLLAPVGRVSLAVYVLHLPVVYGWGGLAGLARHPGPTLGLLPALGVGVGLLLACTAVAWLGRQVLRRPPPAWRPQALPAADRLGSRP